MKNHIGDNVFAIVSWMVKIVVVFILGFGLMLLIDQIFFKTYLQFDVDRRDGVSVAGIVEMKGRYIHKIYEWIAPKLYRDKIVSPAIVEYLEGFELDK